MSIFNKQDVFDRCKAHLLKQNVRSQAKFDRFGDPTDCAYRGSNGRKCAIGIFIPDDYYTESCEGLTPENGGLDHALEFDELLWEDCEFLVKLQLIHDNVLVYDWEASFDELAKKEGLES